MPYFTVSGGSTTSGDTDPHVQAATPEEAAAKFLEGKPEDWTVHSVSDGIKPPTATQAKKLAENRDLTHGLAVDHEINPVEVVPLVNDAISTPNIHTFHEAKKSSRCVICGQTYAKGDHYERVEGVIQ